MIYSNPNDRNVFIKKNQINVTDITTNPCYSVNNIHPSVESKIKRVIDIFGAIVGLSLTAVAFVPIAMAIKIDNSGPIFYSQIRCGYKGRKFRLWKFRSMVTNAGELKSQVKNEIQGAFFKNKNDPRITKVGKILRQTSLDEFPQFWNVLTGEMSLVGTRPPTVEEVEQYNTKHLKRLDVKPGLTGEWQVNGRSSVKNFEQVVDLDLEYQQKWSVLYDLELIFKTIGILFSKTTGAC